MLEISTVFEYKANLIELFRSARYEQYILELMNISKIHFKEAYKEIVNQSRGEADFISASGIKYDAKLPFRKEQFELLTSGKKHDPDFLKWIEELYEESTEFDAYDIINNREKIKDTKLFSTMMGQIVKDKPDENIIFFIPFPIVLTLRGSVIAQFASNFLTEIYAELEKSIDRSRTIYTIYPTHEKNVFAITEMRNRKIEFIEYDGMEEYFSYDLRDF